MDPVPTASVPPALASASRQPATYPSGTPGAFPAPGSPARADETVRPESGTLARGVWEAPAWAFYASIAAVILAALLFGATRARRAGVVRRPRA